MQISERQMLLYLEIDNREIIDYTILSSFGNKKMVINIK